jgi:ketosteroid isomerase-like protein
MQQPGDFAARLRRLEDRVEIGELIARYGLVMDNRDIAQMATIFTADVVIESADGVMNVSGRDAAVAMFRERFRVLGPSNHVTHDRILTFDDGHPDEATGIVLAHAEMNRRGQAMVAAIRYTDAYRREDGRWRFARRSLGFLYYVAAVDYTDALGAAGLGSRNRAYDTPRSADWPESLPTWQEFYGP